MAIAYGLDLFLEKWIPSPFYVHDQLSKSGLDGLQLHTAFPLECARWGLLLQYEIKTTSQEIPCCSQALGRDYRPDHYIAIRPRH
jgi:hypothetical protein